ncbi:MAG: HAD-IIA family hydrolase [Mycobacteriales bacterium]
MTSLGDQLANCAGSLATAYDAALLDLDGVVYRGTEPIPHAASSLTAAAEAGMRLTYVTNNASRTPEQVAELLRAVGVDADPSDVATSAQAAATLLAEQLEPGARVLVIGAAALRLAVSDRGLTPVSSADDEPAAVVQGFSPDTTYAMLAEATLAIRAGALWIATNLDSTIPAARGVLPGNGALVSAVATATGATPIAAGKPQRPLHDEAVRRTGSRTPLVVGDRLDTDIDGALAVGAHSLLVLTGVTSLLELALVPAGRRPSYVGMDLQALLTAHRPVEIDDSAARCGGAIAKFAAGEVAITAGGDATDAVRAGVAAAWRAVDRGDPVSAVRGCDR